MSVLVKVDKNAAPGGARGATSTSSFTLALSHQGRSSQTELVQPVIVNAEKVCHLVYNRVAHLVN